MAANAKARERRIEQKFHSLDGSIKSLNTYLSGESPDVTNAELRLSSIKNMYNEYMHNHQELVSIQKDHPVVNAFPQLETDYFAVATKVQKMKAPVPDPLANSTLLNNTVTFTERHDLPKLAVVPIPKFDGNQENWVIWKPTFESMIHDRPGLSGVVKLSQLKNAVSGLAQLVINEFCRNPSDQNYLAAWEALCKAYDQRRVIINEHFDALYNLAPHPKPTAETTAGLMYTVRQHVSMLKAMDITIGEEAVVRILERCLPKEILEKWIEQVSSDRYPTLDQLYTFIQNSVFKQREIDKAPSMAHPTKRSGGHNSAPPTKMSKQSAKSFVTASISSNNSCPKCGQNHKLYTCEEFKKSSMKDKWDLVKAKKLCRNCLGAHPAPCSSQKKCKRCNKDHHSFLHADKKQKGSQGQSSLPSDEAVPSGATQK